MSRFSKLHETIVTSSIWNEDDTTRIVWVTMLALADRTGFVGASVGGLAHSARVSEQACQTALAKFQNPDPDSRTKTDEGRRIQEMDGGWKLINFRKYSSIRDEEKRREQTRAAMAKLRAKKSAPVGQKPAPKCEPNVSHGEPHVSHGEPHVSHEPDFTLECEQHVSTGEQRTSKRLPTTEPAKRIAALFSRRLTTAWSAEEIAKFKELGRLDPEDLALIEAYYRTERAKGDGDNGGRHRRDLKTFLNNYPGELDRARAAAPKGKSPNHEDPAGWREWLTVRKASYTPHRFAQDFLKTQFSKSK